MVIAIVHLPYLIFREKSYMSLPKNVKPKTGIAGATGWTALG